MSSAGTAVRVLAGDDGSPSAADAIEIAAHLVPSAAAQVVHLWEPPFAVAHPRQRLAREAANLEELVDLLEVEGRAEADRLGRNGVALAAAAGWPAEALVQRSFGGDGYHFARLAEERGADLVVLAASRCGSPWPKRYSWRDSARRRMPRSICRIIGKSPNSNRITPMTLARRRG
jgi:nucleotide-binding universal stress UspA family protein